MNAQQVPVKMALNWNVAAACWTVDVFDNAGNELVRSLPLVTGTDLLGQFAYLGLGGKLIAQTDGDIYAVPTFENMGASGHLYYIADPVA